MTEITSKPVVKLDVKPVVIKQKVVDLVPNFVPKWCPTWMKFEDDGLEYVFKSVTGELFKVQ